MLTVTSDTTTLSDKERIASVQCRRCFCLYLQHLQGNIYNTDAKIEEVLAKLKIRGVFAAIGITKWHSLYKNENLAGKFSKFSSILNNVLVKCNASKQTLLKD